MNMEPGVAVGVLIIVGLIIATCAWCFRTPGKQLGFVLLGIAMGALGYDALAIPHYGLMGEETKGQVPVIGQMLQKVVQAFTFVPIETDAISKEQVGYLFWGATVLALLALGSRAFDKGPLAKKGKDSVGSGSDRMR